ncbi:MAG: RNA polymerase sigma-70 factor [Bacteroidota bacterium]|nr:RNA polymerase sigma-70 factor [Bacteroidota bacterium]
MKRHVGISDDKLLDMLRHEENAFAFEEIYNRYWHKLYAAAYKRVKSVEGAEEIVQDLFTDIWDRRKTINITSELPVYLYTAVKYRVINFLHKEALKNSYVSSAVVPEYDNSTEETVWANDLRERLQSKVKLLPVKCREVFELSRVAHQSNKQIATQLGISEKTVENQITKALRRLRTSLNTFFLLF